MSGKIINHEGVLYQHGEGTIEGGGFVRPSDDKQEEYHEYWEDDLKAARGIFGYPLLVSIIFLGLLAVGLLL